MQGFKASRGRCHFCGNFGHKQNECPFKNTNETRKPTKTTEIKIIKKKQHQKLLTIQMTTYLPEDIDSTESVTTAENWVIGKKIVGF